MNDMDRGFAAGFMAGFIFMGCCVLALMWAISMAGCAYGKGWWLFPQDVNGYHFNPCLYPERVRPEDRTYYDSTCRDSDTWNQWRRSHPK